MDTELLFLLCVGDKSTILFAIPVRLSEDLVYCTGQFQVVRFVQYKLCRHP